VVLCACAMPLAEGNDGASILSEVACSEVSPDAPTAPARCWTLAGEYQDAREASEALRSDARFAKTYAEFGLDSIGGVVCDEIEPPDSPLIDIDTVCFVDLISEDGSTAAHAVVTRPFVEGDTARLLAGER